MNHNTSATDVRNKMGEDSNLKINALVFQGKLTEKNHDLNGKINGFRLRCSLKPRYTTSFGSDCSACTANIGLSSKLPWRLKRHGNRFVVVIV